MRDGGAADTNDVYAGFWRRLLAWAIDAALLTVLYVLLVHLFGGGIEHRGGMYLFMVEPGRPATDLIVLVAWLYYAGCESSVLQGTVGKQLVGIVVADAEGQRLSLLNFNTRCETFQSCVEIRAVGHALISLTFNFCLTALSDAPMVPGRTSRTSAIVT